MGRVVGVCVEAFDIDFIIGEKLCYLVNNAGLVNGQHIYMVVQQIAALRSRLGAFGGNVHPEFVPKPWQGVFNFGDGIPVAGNHKN